MSLQISLPFSNKSKNNVKGLVFSILAKEYPLKIIEIKNFINKRYGRNVSFQAVRKAMLELVGDGVLLKKENSFIINKQWVFDSKRIIDELYSTIYQEKETKKSVESIGEEISVFTFNSVGEMMKFWEHLIDNWIKENNEIKLKINCYQSFHIWENLLYPESEQKVMSKLNKKGIKSYVLCTGSTKLDKLSLNFYKNIGLTIIRSPSKSLFDKEYSVGTYGELVIQTLYPKEIINELDNFFKKTNSLKDLDLNKLSNIINKKIEAKLTVSKNINLAKQINHSIISQIS